MITSTTPFFQVEVPLNSAHIDTVVNTVKTFANLHKMDFLSAGDSLPAGDFQAYSDGPGINLGAAHISPLMKGVQVWVTVRGEPTPSDKALAVEFLDQIRVAAR